jgi:hypothetical protein
MRERERERKYREERERAHRERERRTHTTHREREKEYKKYKQRERLHTHRERERDIHTHTYTDRESAVHTDRESAHRHPEYKQSPSTHTHTQGEMERLQAACVGTWGGVVLRRLRKGGALHADATAAEQLRWTAPFSMLLGAGCASLTVDEVRNEWRQSFSISCLVLLVIPVRATAAL